MAQKTIKKIEKGRPINVGSMKVRELLPTDSGFLTHSWFFTMQKQ